MPSPVPSTAVHPKHPDAYHAYQVKFSRRQSAAEMHCPQKCCGCCNQSGKEPRRGGLPVPATPDSLRVIELAQYATQPRKALESQSDLAAQPVQ